MLSALGEAAAGPWCRAAAEVLSDSRAGLDELNVFPVPDGDTGTNLLLTVQAALAELEAGARGGESPWQLLARGAVLGARGNSGAILAQLLRGLADQLAGTEPADGPTLAVALRKAAEAAYSAVADPEEGTILTVAQAGADAAVAAVDAGRTALADVVGATADGARVALEATPDQLAVLREAGVVDAGGAGLCLVLDALVRVVTGGTPARPPLQRRRRPGSRPRVADLPHQPPAGPGNEVQYLLAGAEEIAVARLKERLAALGDSVVVGGVDTTSGREWNVHVHVHVTDVGAAIEAGIEAGRPYCISVTPLAPPPPPAVVPGRRAVVAVAPSDGLAELLRHAGVRVLVGGPEEVDEDRLLTEILACRAEHVVVLPNDDPLAAAANHAAARARAENRDVVVVPTRSPLQALAAVAVAEPGRRFADDAIAMAEAAASTRWAEVTFAEGEALTSAGLCRAGDVLGSAEGDVVLIGGDVVAVSCGLLDRMLSAGGELVTLVVGSDPAVGDAVCAHLTRQHPVVEVTRYDGAPPAVALLVGVE